MTTEVKGAEDPRSELDSHADTCVIGDNALVTFDYEREVRVSSYDVAQGSKVYRTVSAAKGYDDPQSGQLIVLRVNQAIHIPTLAHNLLCLMQLRLNDVVVNEVPKFLVPRPTDKHHAIILPAQGESTDEFIIPLSLQDVTSYFPTRRPTAEELAQSIADGNCYDLTGSRLGPERPGVSRVYLYGRCML